MESREKAELAFIEADKANAKKTIEKLNALVDTYKVCINQELYSKELKRQYNELLKKSDFTHNDVIAALVLRQKDSLNKFIINQAGEVAKNETDRR